MNCLTYEKPKASVCRKSECTECGGKDVKVMVMTAEINAGELFTVEVCRECLLKFAKRLE